LAHSSKFDVMLAADARLAQRRWTTGRAGHRVIAIRLHEYCTEIRAFACNSLAMKA
jgi:hypothetical protein